MTVITTYEASNQPLNSQMSLADSLYNFIANADYKAELEAQIEQYEEDLKYLSDLTEMFDKLGYNEMAEDAIRRYNSRNENILLLKLKVNELDKQMLLFELEALRRD
jgi:hypothetical protein